MFLESRGPEGQISKPTRLNARKAMTQANTRDWTTTKAAHLPPTSLRMAETVATQGKYSSTKSMKAQLVAGVNVFSSLSTVGCGRPPSELSYEP